METIVLNPNNWTSARESVTAFTNSVLRGRGGGGGVGVRACRRVQPGGIGTKIFSCVRWQDETKTSGGMRDGQSLFGAFIPLFYFV